MKTKLHISKYYYSLGFCAFFLFNLSITYGQAEYGFVEGVNFKGNVTYKSGLVMDIFYPDPAKMQEKNPWVVFVHGGGWAGGTLDDIYKASFLSTLKKLVENGVVVSTIKYRLAKSPVTSYESVVDCKDAARFLLKNAALYKLDEDDYGIWGGSAGAHLSLVTALVPDSNFPGDTQLATITPKYKCVAAFYPFTSCLNADLFPGSIFEDKTLFLKLLGGTLEEKPDLARLLSPTEFLEASSPPILLVHGNKDTTLPILNSQFMVAVAAQKNADVKLLTVANAGHSFSGSNISPSIDEVGDYTAQFFVSHFSKTLSIGKFKETLSASFLYPNPVSNQIKLDMSKEEGYKKYTIFDVNGRVNMQGSISIGTKDLDIDVSSLSKGLYMISVSGDNSKKVLKFVKN